MISEMVPSNWSELAVKDDEAGAPMLDEYSISVVGKCADFAVK